MENREQNENVQDENVMETSTNQNSDNTETSSEENPIAELEEKNRELNDKYVRLFSEFDNYRKRSIKERSEILSSAAGDMIKELLPIVDDFERAIKANKDIEDAAALKEGFDLIYQKVVKLLKSKEVSEMDSVGKTFDSEIHEAITNIPAPTEDLKGKVVDVIEKGYYLKDKVIRFAKVVVGN